MEKFRKNMKAIYSLALGLLACASVFGQTTVYSQDYTTFPPQNWYLGYTYDGAMGNGPASEDEYNVYWIQRPFLNDQTTGNPSISVEFYSSSLSCWAISPVFDLSAGGYSVSFDYGATDGIYSPDPTAAAPQTTTDDVFKFLISQDNGTTWQELESVTSPNGTAPHTRTTKTYSLANYTSATTKFAFYTSNGTDPNWGTEYVLYFDDFKITNGTLSTTEAGAKNKSFALYPNPTTGVANVKTDRALKSIDVFDVTGKLISTGKEINLSSVVAGTYIVKINFADGTFATEKIIKR